MGNQKLKKALIAFFIISLVCLLAYAGTLFGYIFAASGNDINVTLNYFGAEANVMVGAILYPFVINDLTTAFADFYNIIGIDPLIMSIILLVVASLFVVLLVIGLIRVFSKHKGGFAFYALAWLAALYVVGTGLGCESILLYSAVESLFAGPAADDLLPLILATCAFVFSILAVITVIITYILGLKYAGVKQEAAKVDSVFETEQPVLSEENLSPEEAQDVVAENNPEYVAVLEPEPEPDPILVAEENEEVQEEPALEAEPEEVQEEPEPVQYVEPEPIPEPQPDETNNHVEVNVNNNPAPQAPAGIDPNSLASLLREVVRDIVRDEIARNNANQPRVNEDTRSGGNQTITGATFGGPLVVQYFNGGINGVTPPQAPVEAAPVKEEAKPAPVEEKKEEPAPQPEPVKEEVQPEPVKEEPQPAPAPAPEVVQPAPVPEAEKPVYERLSFAERLLQADQEILDLYNELKNEILSYGVKSRISAVGDTFRLHKKMYVRITVAGKSLKLYFALNPDDYKDSKIPVQDAGHKDLYAEIPLVFKVRSGLSVRRCKELIQDTMEKDGLEQGEIGKVNWVKELKAEMKEKAKGNKDDED